MIYEIIFALGLIFTWAWIVVVMMGTKVTNEKLDKCCTDLWDTMACKVNHTEYDAKEYMDLHHRDVLYTSHVAMRQDFEKSVKNISTLAHILGYQWSVTDAKNNIVPGYWAKAPTARIMKGKTGFEQYCDDLLKGTKYTDKKKSKVSVNKTIKK